MGLNIDDGRFIEGASEAKEKLLPWLRMLLKSPESEEAFLVKLLQASRGSEVQVGQWTLDYGEDLGEFIDRILEAAENDVDEFRGKIKYAVRAFVGGKTSREIFYLKVPKTQSEEDSDDPFEDDFDDAPTRRGLIGQQMKHAEVLMKTTVAIATQSRKELLEEKRELMGENRELRRQLHEQNMLLEDVRNMQFQRNLELRKLDREDERRAEMAGTLKQMLPLVASYMLPGGLPPGMAGPPGMPGSPPGGAPGQPGQSPGAPGIQGYGAVPPGMDPRAVGIALRQSYLLEGFIPSLSQETILAIVPLLNDVQRMSLHQLHQLVLEKQALNPPVTSSSTPTPQANGNGVAAHHGT